MSVKQWDHMTQNDKFEGIYFRHLVHVFGKEGSIIFYMEDHVILEIEAFSDYHLTKRDRAIGVMSRVFANGPRSSHTKDSKKVT